MYKSVSIPKRLEKIFNLTKNADLDFTNPLINLNKNIDTVNYYSNNTTNDEESTDTRIVLGKKHLNITDVMTKLNGNLIYIKSGGYGHTFKGVVLDENDKVTNEFAVKVVAYSKNNSYGTIYNTQRPENAEICMLKVLSYFVIKGQTPHIILPISVFDTKITPFLKLQDRDKIPKNNENYTKFIENYKKGLYYDDVSVIISEWANSGDLSVFLKNNYKKLKLIHWKCLFFQLISTLAVIQIKFPEFRHNDLKANNILVSKTQQNSSFIYRVNNVSYSVPTIGYTIFLIDWDFAQIPNIVDNIKLHQEWTKKFNITSVQQRYYDIHYFFCSLICKGFLPEILTDPIVPIEVKEFINYVVPEEYRPSSNSGYVNKKCRLQVDTELHLPVNLLKHDFFKEFRIEKN
jgi:hypothetical protein